MLKQRLQTLMNDHGVNYVAGKKSFVTDCLNPSCLKESHLYVRHRDGKGKCFKCGESFTWQRIVSIITRCKLSEAYGVLFGRGAGDLVEKELEFSLGKQDSSDKNKSVQIYLGPDFFPVGASDIGLSYLVKRGITNPQLVLDYDIRYHAAMNAVVFPVKRDGAVYGWQARYINPTNPKLRMISHTFDKSNFLLNWDRAKWQKSLFLVEGPFDCVHVDVDGVGAVASLGKIISPEQLRLMMNSEAKNIYLGLDDDASSEVYDIITSIGFRKKVFRAVCPPNREDFGECNVEEVLGAIKSAIPIKGSADFLNVYFKQ